MANSIYDYISKVSYKRIRITDGSLITHMAKVFWKDTDNRDDYVVTVEDVSNSASIEPNIIAHNETVNDDDGNPLGPGFSITFNPYNGPDANNYDKKLKMTINFPDRGEIELELRCTKRDFLPNGEGDVMIHNRP